MSSLALSVPLVKEFRGTKPYNRDEVGYGRCSPRCKRPEGSLKEFLTPTPKVPYKRAYKCIPVPSREPGFLGATSGVISNRTVVRIKTLSIPSACAHWQARRD